MHAGNDDGNEETLPFSNIGTIKLASSRKSLSDSTGLKLQQLGFDSF